MDRNAALAMFLIFAIWMVYILVYSPKQRPEQLAQQPLQEDTLKATTGSTQADQVEKLLPEAQPALAQPMEDPQTELPVDTVVVTSDLYEYRFTTHGGVLSRAWLKKYFDFSQGGKDDDYTGALVQLVPADSTFFLYSVLHFSGTDRTVELGRRHFEPNATRLALSETRPSGKLEFTSQLAGGAETKIIYTFRNDSYLVDAELYLPDQLYGQKGSTLEVLLGPTLASNEKNLEEDYGEYNVVYYDDGEVVKKTLKNLDESDWSPSGEHSILWGGLKSKYFLTAFFVPGAPMTSLKGTGKLLEHRMAFSGIFPIPDKPGPINFSFYVGPQAYQQFKQLNFGISKLIQYGWSIIQPFCKIILTVLLWMHQYIPNYAVLLIIFPLLVKVVFWPLTVRTTKSQIKMQQIQPLMNELKVKYKDDPQKQQQETLKLYREHKVNPLGGCLPLLIQMPVLIAMFFVFRLTIEFRGEPAFGWINDLSEPDPYYILPVLMGATQFLQQKLSPTPMDPKMAPMMYMMPIVMIFFFLKFSSGLNFYYTWFNIFSIAQQLYINHKYHKPAGTAGAVSPVHTGPGGTPQPKGPGKRK